MERDSPWDESCQIFLYSTVGTPGNMLRCSQDFRKLNYLDNRYIILGPVVSVDPCLIKTCEQEE